MTTIVDGTAGITFPAGGVGNPAGAVVGTTDTQTLTNKTLTGAVINGTVGATTPAAGAFTTVSATGITTVAAGSAALPAIVSTTGTADTGLWFPAADTVAASTAGTERMRIDSSGNVGIGTTSPSTYVNGYGPVLVTGTGNNFATVQGRTDGPSGLTSGVSYGGSYSTNPINGSRMTLNAEGGSGQRGSVSFWTKALDDSSTQPIERVRITQAGVLQFNSGYGSAADAYGCRAWCQYNNSQAIVGSANISSITVLGTGDVRLNFTTAMPDANYSAVATTNEEGGTAKFCNATQPSTTTIRIVTFTFAGIGTNNTYNFVAIFR